MSGRLVRFGEVVLGLVLPVAVSATMVIARKGQPFDPASPGILPRLALLAGVLIAGLIERRISAVSRSKEAGSANGV